MTLNEFFFFFKKKDNLQDGSQQNKLSSKIVVIKRGKKICGPAFIDEPMPWGPVDF
jgi:hypothetical protein